MEGFRRTESWTSSEASSSESLSRARPLRFAQQRVPHLDSFMSGSTSTEWTDEKHNLYLESMEASFLDQLYDSMDYELHRSYSDQFKVLQGGCWKKIDFERHEFRQNKRDRSSCFMASPWIQHFRSGSKSRLFVSCGHLQDNASPKEASDQNFVDEKQCGNTILGRSSKEAKNSGI